MRGHLLGPLEGCITRKRPSNWNVRKTIRAADIVEMSQDILSRVWRSVKRRYLIESPRKATLRAHAVVAGNVDDQGVVVDT